MSTYYPSPSLEKNNNRTKKPLKLVASISPRTSVFEKQLGLINSGNGNFYFTAHKAPGRTNIGGYMPPSPDSFDLKRPSPALSPLKSGGRKRARHYYTDSPVFGKYSTDQDVCVKIPLHRVKIILRTMGDFFESLTRDDLERFVDYVSYSGVGGFAVFGEAILQTSKPTFTILVPLVLIGVIKISLKKDNVLVGSSFGQMVVENSVPLKIQHALFQTTILLKLLLLLLATKTTSAFKYQTDYTSHLEVGTLLVLGMLIVGIFVSLFHSVVFSLSLNAAHNCTSDISTSLRDSPRGTHSSEPDSPQLYADYCVLSTPEIPPKGSH